MNSSVKILLTFVCLAFQLQKFSILADKDFKFDEEIYAHVIKSTHKPFKTALHIKTPNCIHGQVHYSLYNHHGPFRINHNNGTIYLEHALDANGPNRFIFNVRAKDASGQCSANAELQIYVVHVNEHKPIMSAAKYHCSVNENERTVKVTPPIFATDKDEGAAGLIKAIHVREQGIPFKIEVDKVGKANMVVIADLDAESMGEYYFTIYAVDNGTRARKSERSRVYCKVLDVNEFSPIFRNPQYAMSVERGKTYNNILKLEAIDRDISSKMGKVCNYAIVERKVPFEIDKNGILSLPRPLSGENTNYMEFHVRATDCGNMDSEDDAVVKVTVIDRPIAVTSSSQLKVPGCSPAISIKSETQLSYPSCTDSIPLLPLVEVNHCNDDAEHEFSVKAHLDSSFVRKGCERSHDDIVSTYKHCGVTEVTDLLPTTNNAWVDDLIKEETIQGETNYIFDSNSAVRLPKNIVGTNWEDTLTIAAWVLVKTSPKPQFILSWSDGRQLGSTYMGLFVINKGSGEKPRIGFVMNKNNGKCRFNEEWNIELWDFSWRHVAVVVSGCNLQLLVDGNPVEPNTAKETFTPQQTHIQPKYVIGGRWLGTHQKYTDFFNGKISQLVFTKSKVKDFRCILQCKEKVDVLSPLLNGFQLETSFQDQSIWLTGHGRISSLQTMLRRLVYSNTEPYPSIGNRMIRIETEIDRASLPAIHLEVDSKKTTGPGIVLAGKCDGVKEATDMFGNGLQLCEKIDIKVEGCLKKLDEAMITFDPEAFLHSNISISNVLLKRFGLTRVFTSSGVRISGSTRSSHYAQVIESLTIVPKNKAIPESFDVAIEVSAQNGRFTSNTFVVEVKTKHKNTVVENGSAFFFDTRVASSNGGAVSNNPKTEKANNNKSIILVLIVSGFAVASVLIGAVTIKFIRRSKEDELIGVENDYKPDLLWDDEGFDSMNITLNPLIRFRQENFEDSLNSLNSYEEESSEASLYWSESDEEVVSEEDCVSDEEVKTGLEWDSSYQEEFGEDYTELGDVKMATRPGDVDLSAASVPQAELIENHKESDL